MKVFLKTSILCAAVILLAASCNSNVGKMRNMKGVVATCEPAILEARAGQVPTNVSITFPKKYFQPNALMVITPVITYEGGEITGEPKIYQGYNVKDNYIEVPFEGATLKQAYTYRFREEMRNCQLELRPVLIDGDKKYNLDPIKVAEGCRTLIQDAVTTGAFDYKPDGYADTIYTKTEGRILYDVNSAAVKSSELKGESISEMQRALKEIKEDGKSRITGTEIVTYASPEGGVQYNAELSEKRAQSATKAWSGINEGVVTDTKQTNVTSVGQDWEGFAEAVSKSKIVDKDLILRILSMYSDPETREKEIRNLSEVFTELKTEVFPELRRARFITNSEYANYTDEELVKLAEYRLYAMDEPSLLRLAALSDKPEQKTALYKMAIDRYNSQTALYNAAVVEMNQNNFLGARDYLKMISNQKDPEVLNALGVCAMNRGEFDDAEEYFIRSASPQAKENLGTLSLIQGNYADAAKKLEGSASPNLAVALLMDGQADKAVAAVKGDDAESDYLRAVAAARQGSVDEAKKWIQSAVTKDPSLAQKVKKDIEFAKLGL